MPSGHQTRRKRAGSRDRTRTGPTRAAAAAAARRRRCCKRAAGPSRPRPAPTTNRSRPPPTTATKRPLQATWNCCAAGSRCPASPPLLDSHDPEMPSRRTRQRLRMQRFSNDRLRHKKGAFNQMQSREFESNNKRVLSVNEIGSFSYEWESEHVRKI